MFKKRPIQKQTSINLNDIVIQISTVPQRQQQNAPLHQNLPNVHPSANMDDDITMKKEYSLKDSNSNTLGRKNILYEELEHHAGQNPYKPISNLKLNDLNPSEQKLKQQQNKQMEECFAQFIKLQKQQQRTEMSKNYNQKYTFNQSPSDQQKQNGISNKIIEQPTPFDRMYDAEPYPKDQYQNQENFGEEILSEGQVQGRGKQMPVIHQVIVEDQSGDHVQLLEIHEDYGEISPEQSDSQENQYGYENQIIKRTLTKHNYQQIQKSLHSSFKKSNKNKLLKQLQKISYSGVQRKIGKDLRLRKEKKNQLLNEMKYIDHKVNLRRQEISRKISDKGELEQKMDKVKRILEVLYYFGNHLNGEDINEQYLQQIVYEQEWRQKIDKIRSKIKKGSQQFLNRKKKTINLDEQSQKEQKSLASGDVEQIPKYRVGEGWNGWPVNDDEEIQDQKIRQISENEGDDDCFELDD